MRGQPPRHMPNCSQPLGLSRLQEEPRGLFSAVCGVYCRRDLFLYDHEILHKWNDVELGVCILGKASCCLLPNNRWCSAVGVEQLVLSSWCWRGHPNPAAVIGQRARRERWSSLVTRHETTRVYLQLPAREELACTAARRPPLLCSTPPTFLTTAAVSLSVCLPAATRPAGFRTVPIVGAFAAEQAVNWSVTYRFSEVRSRPHPHKFFPGSIILFTFAPVPRPAEARLQLLLPRRVCYLLKQPAVSRPALKEPVPCLLLCRALGARYPTSGCAGRESSSSRHSKVRLLCFTHREEHYSPYS
ncbi:hypothetical protein P171DRAFT_492918, partial [Karstenula rhodostoma CBS 690.94]